MLCCSVRRLALRRVPTHGSSETPANGVLNAYVWKTGTETARHNRCPARLSEPDFERELTLS